MSDYVKTTDFTAKDSLATGTPSKRLKGSELDTEFDAIAVAIADKQDTSEKGSANGYAGLNSSGLVPEDQLGTGTGTSSKYLRGDGTWHPITDFVAAGDTLAAANITYDNSTSDLTATQVQAAIDELAALISPSATDITIPANTFNFNLVNQLYGGTAPSHAVTVNITVPAGVMITSLSTATPAMDLTGLHTGSTINLVNEGIICGRGGAGGLGGAEYNDSGGPGLGNSEDGCDGLAGGDAIKGPGSGNTLNITNASGYIFGGGGGGGGGGWAGGGSDEAAAGGGGGGGAGGGEAGRGRKVRDKSGTANAATNGGVGVLTIAGTATTGGTGADSGSGTAGNGGAGGTWGAAGSAGTSTHAGSGGAAGKAIAVTSGTANFISGNNATHVKGAVS